MEELYLLALNVIEVKREKLENFKIGFHNQPSMQRLHLHVISKDFVSDCLKTKKHWNSFNTELFLNYEGKFEKQFKIIVCSNSIICIFVDLYKQLEENGKVKRLDSDTLKTLSNKELKCNQCDFVGKNIPTLKQHLLEHLN